MLPVRPVDYGLYPVFRILVFGFHPFVRSGFVQVQGRAAGDTSVVSRGHWGVAWRNVLNLMTMNQFSSHQKTFPSGLEAKRGFALIITISLMAFLVLLLVTVGTFTRIETQVAGYTLKQSIAREHAKKAMEHAIAELQRHAGRDDRVTNRWERFSPGFIAPGNLHHPFWTAVWNPHSPGMVETTLVSGNEFFDPRNGTFVPTMQADDDFVRLVGPGSTAEFVPTFDVTRPGEPRLSAYVYAPRIPLRVDHYPGLGTESITGGNNQLPSGGHIIGHYAYWVGDEGVKASLAQAGDRYPIEEFYIGNDASQQDIFRERLDNWGNNVFLSQLNPPMVADDFARTISPTRFGFSYLNTLSEPDFPTGDFHYFGQNYQPGDLNSRHINPRLSAWQRVITRGQAHGETVNGNFRGLIRNPEWGDRPYGFSKRDSINDAAEEMERLFHDTTAYSRGVQATTRQNGGLKIDLTRFSQPGWNSDHRAWANARATSRLAPGSAGTPDSDNPEYPLGVVAAVSPFAQPVVTHAHVLGSFTGNGLGENIDLNLVVRLGLWNPFDVDLEVDSFSVELEGDMQVAVGLWWEHEEEEFDPVFDVWVGDLVLLSDDRLAFERNAQTRIFSGETHLFSVDSAGALVTGQFAPASPGLGYTLFEARPTISFPEGNTLNLRVLTNEGELVILEDSVSLQDVSGIDAGALPSYANVEAWRADWGSNGNFFTYMADFDAPGSQLPFGFGVDTQGRIITGLDNSLPPLRNLSYEERGRTFYGHQIPNVLARPDNSRRGYALVFFDPGMGIPSVYQDSNQAYANQLENQGIMTINPGSSSPASRPPPHMTFYHILRDVQQDLQSLSSGGFSHFGSGNWTDDWIPISSVGQLRVRVERPPATMFDTHFFSTAVLPSSANAGWPFFLNPRIRPYLDETGFDTDTLNRMRDSGEAAAHVLNDGAFNINSTSVKAWAALLHSFAGQDLLVFSPFTGEVYRHNDQFANSPLGSFYSRFSSAPGATFFGRENIAGTPARSIWRNSLRELKPLNLEFPLNNEFTYQFWSEVNDPGQGGQSYNHAAMAMAEIIVDKIRSYGNPVFGTVAEFIGSGILQDAIDEVRWQTSGGGGIAEVGLNWYFDGAEWRRIPRASPSFLTQDDLLATLGSVLTARSDTFIVRAYGDAHNPVTGRVEARAWLEAVVQRVPTPINPDASGVEPQNPSTDRFGRKFEVVQFRWLEPDEI